VSRYLLVSRSADFEARLESMLGSALTSISGDRLSPGSGSVVARTVTRPSVAILGPLLSYEETRELSLELTGRHSGMAVLLVHSGRSELEDWVDEMIVHAVIDPDADDATVRRVIDRLEEMNPNSPVDPIDAEHDPDEPESAPPIDVIPPTPYADRRQVIAVLAPKGGQGKTTIAINLATGLAEVAPNSVVLVDADLQFGDIGNALDVSAVRTIADIADSSVEDEMVLKTSLARHGDDFFVVPAPRTPEEADQVSAEGLARLISALSAIFSYVVVDTAPGLGEHTLTVIENATAGLFVSNMSVPALRAMHSELSVLAAAGLLPVRQRLVLNFADTSSGITAKDAARIVGTDFNVVVPRSTGVLLAGNLGVPLIHHDVRDAAAKAIRSLVTDFEPSAVPTRRRIHRRRTS
jgi:MinD-like ATPase involved in chromosome partitioning or flagellar assembly